MLCKTLLIRITSRIQSHGKLLTLEMGNSNVKECLPIAQTVYVVILMLKIRPTKTVQEKHSNILKDKIVTCKH